MPYPYNSYWFKFGFMDETAIDDMENFVVNELGVPRASPEFNNVFTRAAWPIQNLMDRWGIKGKRAPGSYKSRTMVLLESFVHGSSNAEIVKLSVMNPATPEASVYGEHEYELSPKAIAFFKRCADACEARNAADAAERAVA